MSPEMQAKRAQPYDSPAHQCLSNKSGSGLKTPGESRDISVNPGMFLPGSQCTVTSFLTQLPAPLPHLGEAERQLFLYFPNQPPILSHLHPGPPPPGVPGHGNQACVRKGLQEAEKQSFENTHTLVPAKGTPCSTVECG